MHFPEYLCLKQHLIIIAGMLHVLSHGMAEVHVPVRSSRSTLTISPYTRTLKNIASHLTLEDLSSIKLILQSENWFKKKTLDELKNPQELIRLLQGRSLISNEDLGFLSTLLKEIHRKDLAKMLQSDMSDLCGDGDPKMKTAPGEDTGGSQPLSQMSVDEYDEDDNEVIMSSQSSLSDEEKLQVLNIKKVSDCQ